MLGWFVSGINTLSILKDIIMKLSDILKEATPEVEHDGRLPGESKAHASMRKAKEREAEQRATKKAKAIPMGSCPPINKGGAAGTWEGD